MSSIRTLLGLPSSRSKSTFDPKRALVTSPFLTPFQLACIRLTLAFYTLFYLLFDIIWQGVRTKTVKSFFSFFTTLSYIGLCSYLFASGTQTLIYALRLRSTIISPSSPSQPPSLSTNTTSKPQSETEIDGEKKESELEGGVETEKQVEICEEDLESQSQSGSLESTLYPLQTWPVALQFLHVLLLATVFVFPILVTIIFWAVLSGPQTLDTTYDRFSNISGHALNTVFACFEILCTHAGTGFTSSSTPPPSTKSSPESETTPTTENGKKIFAYKSLGLIPWLYAPLLVVLLGCYLGVAYITFATQGFYTYSFLDPKTQHALLAAWIVGIGAACILLFTFVTRGVVPLREWVAVKLR